MTTDSSSLTRADLSICRHRRSTLVSALAYAICGSESASSTRTLGHADLDVFRKSQLNVGSERIEVLLGCFCWICRPSEVVLERTANADTRVLHRVSGNAPYR